MARDQYVNKVVFYGRVIIDITDATATAGDVLSGKTFYAASGERLIGTLEYNDISRVSVSGNTITVPAGYWPSDVRFHTTGWEWDNLVFTMGDVITEGATGYLVD